jgi:hypothetical protein
VNPFYGLGFVALLAALEEASKDGRVVMIVDDPLNKKPEPIAALISGPIELKIPKPRPERCHERPHKKWPVRR